MRVGDVCIIERRFSHASSLQNAWEKAIVRITPTRAYFNNGDWFALGDPRREVKPKYLDYTTVVASVAGQSEGPADG